MILAFLQKVVELPAPLTGAILVAVTLLLGMVLKWVASLWPWLADFLGQYVEEVSVAIAGAFVTWLNGWLAQIPANWEAVGLGALQLVVLILAALHVVTLFRKIRASVASAVLDSIEF